ncbi:hypothetical protein PRIC1_001569 [Phytophthora ramorum]|nr:hypothetical protein KRP23_9838 [Phytophthora ramorum]KAH7504081.1 hypothetical protein KRP22_7127 [Phytophthora ramorum]
MISPEVMQELLSVRQVLHYLPESASSEKGWTPHEQQLFWVALTQHPAGPWTTIAEFIGTKSARQAMTHGQKLRQKLKRWNERLRSNPTASLLMDGVNVSTSADVTVTAGISIETMSAMTEEAATDGNVGLLPASPAHAGELQPGLIVDGVSIVEMDGLHVSDISMLGPNCVIRPGIGAPQQHPNSTVNHHHLSDDTTRVVELMLSEYSEEVTVTDFADDPEILPQDLLDELLEILSDDELNELSHHHNANMV